MFLCVLLSGCSVIMPKLIPFKNLPTPSGRFAVGTQILNWTDSTRDEWFTEDDIDDKRKLVVQIWYPTNEVNNEKYPYMDNPDKRLGPLSQQLELPVFMIRHIQDICTNSILNAPLHPEVENLPVILFSHGLRPFTDIDVDIGLAPNISTTHNYIDKVNFDIVDENTCLFFIDSYVKTKDKLNLAKKKITNKDSDKWRVNFGKMVGLQNIYEIIFNPKYHYYFLGMKFQLLDLHIILLNLRLKPASIADLLMINEKINKKIKINNIPKYSIFTKKDNVKSVFLQDIQ